MTTLKQMANGLRRVWSPPERRALSLSDVAILRLLKAIEALPEEDELRALFEKELVLEHDKVGQAQFDVADAMAAFDRVRRLR